MGINIQAATAAYGAKIYTNSNKTKKESVQTTERSQVTEKVEISDESSTLAKVKAEVDKTPEIRLDLVKEIQARIKSNDYPIENNLDEITDRLIQSKILE